MGKLYGWGEVSLKDNEFKEWCMSKFQGNEYKPNKLGAHLGILFEVSTEIVPHIFWKGYRKYT